MGSSPVRGRDPVDPAFPSLHIRPAAGWLNDPNGVSFVDGVYHVFFQYNPMSARHAQICWGHSSSTDLVSWEEQPLALVPRAGRADSFGCWSGCVTVVDGVPTAVYSGGVGEGGDTSVLLAESDRAMRVWRQGEQPVASTPAGLAEMRDPFVVEVEGHRWAVQCAVPASGECTVAVHSCDDVHRWRYHGPLLTPSGLTLVQKIVPAVVWECPQLCRIDGAWVLVLSPLVGVPGQPLDFGRVGWVAGDLSEVDGCLRFEPGDGGLVDVGPAFYAPQVLALPDRALAWGWIREHGRTQKQIDAAGWAGVVSFPRELRLRDGVLVSEPAQELHALRQVVLHEGPVPVGGVVVTERSFEVELSPDRHATEIRLALGADEPLAIPVPEGAGARVLVDGSVIEAFVDGQPSSTHRAYPASTGAEWSIHAEGSDSVRVWRLGLPDRSAGDRGDGDRGDADLR